MHKQCPLPRVSTIIQAAFNSSTTARATTVRVYHMKIKGMKDEIREKETLEIGAAIGDTSSKIDTVNEEIALKSTEIIIDIESSGTMDIALTTSTRETKEAVIDHTIVIDIYSDIRTRTMNSTESCFDIYIGANEPFDIPTVQRIQPLRTLCHKKQHSCTLRPLDIRSVQCFKFSFPSFPPISFLEISSLSL